MKQSAQESQNRRNLAHAIQPKNEKVTLVVFDKRGKTPELQRTGLAQARATNRMTRGEYLKISGAREYAKINDGADEKDGALEEKEASIAKNGLQKTMPAMSRSKGSLHVGSLKQQISFINTAADPMQESLFARSIQRGRLTIND